MLHLFPFLVLTRLAAGDVVFLSSSHSFQLVTETQTNLLAFSPPDSRTRHVAEFLQDKVIICDGGNGASNAFEQSCYQLSSECSGWISPAREARWQSTSASDGDKMFVMGGYEHPDSPDDLESSDSIEVYDPSKGYWSMTNWRMPTARNEPCAVYIGGDEVMLLGGNPSWQSAHILNIEDGYWTQLPDSPEVIGSSGCATGTYQGQKGVFVTGGYGNFNSSLFFDLNTKEWKKLPGFQGESQMTMANPGGIWGENPIALGGHLGQQVEVFDGAAWKIVDIALEDGNTRGSASTRVTDEFAAWLLTVEQVDWSEENMCSSGGTGEGKLKLSNIYADHMVFQRAPSSPMVWGYGTPGSKITITVLDSSDEDVTNGEEDAYVEEDEKFEAKIGSYLAGTGFSIIVRETLPGGDFLEVSLSDVAFGDVWVCSGQSNMELRVKDARDGTDEAIQAETYENIRLLKPVRQIATEPQDEALGFFNSWSKPRVEFLASGDSFSAICLFFGEQLWDELQVPIGLIESTWGGTIVEAWSSPEALEYCGVTDDGVDDGQNHNNYLWNAMIHPFLKMSIKGAIWYQGEQNAGYPGDYEGHNRDLYSCTFPTMIESWRQEWSTATRGDTDRKFPFGFVQLAPFTNQRNSLAWPQLRWHQTADVGYVPNDIMEHVFMATAVDDDIDLHPKNKRLPAERLAWAATNLAYGITERPLAGPLPTSVSFKDTERSSMVITFSQALDDVTIEDDRFMVCCLNTAAECDQVSYGEGWKGATIVGMYSDNAVELSVSNTCSSYSAVAYLWLETPCSGEVNCPLYADDDYHLPVAPWKADVDLALCPLLTAHGGQQIPILATGELFLLQDSQDGCHDACLAHPECQYYQWYDHLSSSHANECFLLASQTEEIIEEEFLQYGAKRCAHTPSDPLDIFFETFGNGAGNGGRDSFSPDYVEALTASIQSEDLYYAGLYQEASNVINSIWEKFPAGTNAWGPIMGEAGKHGEKDSDPYPLLRMVDDMNWFRLNGNIPDHPKYNATITVVMAKADTVLPTSWDDFDMTTGFMKPNRGVRKVVGFNDHMTANHHKVIFDALRTWIAYIEDAVAEAQIKFTLKVIESDDPVHCDFSLRDAGHIGKFDIHCGYPFSDVMDSLPDDVLETTKWYFMAYPYIPKELTNYTDFQGLHDFQNIGAAWGGTGGCCGGKVMWFGNEMGWTGENTDNLLGNFRYFTEVETRLWWASLQQHELYHYLFRLYPEFHLEDEGHQWFDHSKWPEDFEGLYEKDYFHEALFKRLLLADIPPYEKIL